MVVRAGSLEIRDFSAIPGTEWFIDVPANATMAMISVVNCSLSSSQQMRIEMAAGGTELALDWRRFIASTTVARVDDLTASTIPALTNSAATSGHYAQMQMWNLRTLAPVTAFQNMLMSSWQSRAMMFKSEVSHVQIRISANGATINGGIVYVQFYERPNVVVSRDFGANPGATWDIGSLLEATDGAIVLSSYDLGMSTTTFVNAQTGTDAGASDYRRAWVNNVTNSASLGPGMLAAQAPLTGQGLCSLFLGLPQLTRTLVCGNDFGVNSTGSSVNMSTREAIQIDSSLRLIAGAGTINAGMGYAVKYKL